MNGLKSSSAIFFGKTALMQLQSRTDDDDRSARVVDALTEQVLTEATLLALQHIAERLQRSLVGTGDGLAAAAVVEQSIDRLLQHAPLVANDDLGRIELEKALQTVVAVDDATIQVIQIAGRKATTVEGHQGAQIRRQHRNHRQHHPLGTIPALSEGLHDLESLGELLSLRLARRRSHLLAKLLAQRVDVHPPEHFDDRFAAHPRVELVLAVLFDELHVALFGEKLGAAQFRLFRIDDDVALAVQDLLEVLERDVEHVADAGRQSS